MAVIGGAGIVKQATVPGEALPGYDDTAQNPGQSENVDVAPTIARALGFEAPDDNQGRALTEAFNAASLPPVTTGGGSSGGGGTSTAKLLVTVTPKRVRHGKRVRFKIRVRGRAAGSARAASISRARVSFAGRKMRTDKRGYIKVTAKLSKKKLYKLRAGATGYPKRNVYVRAR
jgi:hypothetical protein